MLTFVVESGQTIVKKTKAKLNLWTRKFSIPPPLEKREYNYKIKNSTFGGVGGGVAVGVKKHGASSRLPSPLLERQHSTYLDSFHTNYIISLKI